MGYSQETNIPYNIVDTGKELVFYNTSEISHPQEGGAFYGQDAGLSGNQPSYEVSSYGLTIYDKFSLQRLTCS